jgi:hypothetical protein
MGRSDGAWVDWSEAKKQEEGGNLVYGIIVLSVR